MRILFVTGTLSHGGAQRVISVVANQLAEFGHDVSLIVFRRYEDEYPINERVQLLSLADSQDEYDGISGPKRVLMLRKLIKKVRPDVAVGFLEGGYGMYISSFGLGFKKVASARVNPLNLLEESGSRGFLNRMWFRHADCIVMQTEGQIKLLPENSGWKNCKVIANPVSDAALAVSAHDYERPFTRIIMAGRLDDQKDYPIAIDAMKAAHEKHPDLRLDIYGDGDDRSLIEKKISDAGLQNVVSLKGWTQDILSEYEKSDLFVMSSKYEGMPNSLMEAMACGLVCVSTDCETGPSDLITDGENGFLVPVSDSTALAERIMQIAEMSKEKRSVIGTAAKDVMARDFSSEKIGRNWEELLTEVLKKGK